MKTSIESSMIIEAFGWTLVHSLWQGLLIALVLMVALRLIPLRFSSQRYVVACSAMLLFVISAVTTLIVALETPTSAVVQEVASGKAFTSLNFFMAPASNSWFASLVNQLSAAMPFIMTCWAVGCTLFLLRMLAGWWYVNQLKFQSVAVDEWSGHVAGLADELHIGRKVTVAKSDAISTPMVIGFIKPFILIPSGIVSGLSYEQLESIFVHELAHIKRHDYLVNILQTIVESIFFFNPFVWIVSRTIRREREYCCDDTVVSARGSSLAYAKALAHLEEMRLSAPGLAITFAEDKNQLLNRIRRIMEKSSKDNIAVEKLLPAILLVVGLVCASWLTIQSDQSQKHESTNAAFAGDTTKKKTRSASYSRSRITTYDKDGKPHDEIVENYSGDEDLRPVIAPIDPMAPEDVRDMFDVPLPPTAFADVDGFVPPIPFLNFTFSGDTVPDISRQEWKAFGDEFEKKFRERFGDFYKSNEKEFDKMMKELESGFERDHAGNFPGFQMNHEEMARLQKMMSEDMADKIRDVQQLVQEQQDHINEIQLDNMRNMELSMQDQRESMKLLERNMQLMEKNMKAFEKELKQELVKDGYLKKDADLENISWDDDSETMKVNGINIKREHQKKYRELQRRYMQSGSGRAE